MTFAQLIGAISEFTTFQVTVCVEPPAQVSPPLGMVTANGPGVAIVLIWKMVVKPTWQPSPPVTTPPPPARLSLTVSLNFIGRATVGSVSPFNPPMVAAGLAG